MKNVTTILSLVVLALSAVNAQAEPKAGVNQDSIYEADGTTLKPGKQPADAPATEWSGTVKRKLPNGGFELCKFQTHVAQVVEGYAGNAIQEQCHPMVGVNSVPVDCTWVDETVGTASQSCIPSEQKPVNPESPFEACKNVRVSLASTGVDESLIFQAQLASVCEMINRPASTFDQITQAIHAAPWYKAVLRGSPPPIPTSSQTENVKTLLDVALQAAQTTTSLMRRASLNFTQKQVCHEARAKVVLAMLQDPNNKELDKVTNLNDPAVMSDKLKGKVSEECAQVTNADMAGYNAALKELRKQMLLTETPGQSPFVETPSAPYIINRNFKTPKNILLASDPVEMGTGFDKVTDEEAKEATATVAGWIKDIEQEFDKKAAAEMKKDPNIVPVSGGARTLGSANKFQHRGGAGDRMNKAWQKFYTTKMEEKREAARKAVEQLTLKHPVFQELNASKPNPKAWASAYDDLISRNTKSAQKVWESMKAGEKVRDKYLADLAKYQADVKAGKPAVKPAEPSISDVRDIQAAKGALNSMAEDDPRLCGALTMYSDTVDLFNIQDTVIEVGAIVGASTIAGVLTGGVGAAGVGFIAGGVMGTVNYTHDNKPTIGDGLLTVCDTKPGNKDVCRTLGDFEKYFDDKFNSNLGIMTSFIPFGQQDVIATKIVAAGAISAGLNLGRKATTGTVSFLKNNGKVDMEKMFAAFSKGSADQLAKMFKSDAASMLGAADKLIYSRAFGKGPYTLEQKQLADDILNAIYLEGKGGMLVATDPQKNPQAFIRDLASVADVIKAISERGGDMAPSMDKVMKLFAAMQNPPGGIVADPAHTTEILRTAYLALSEGKSVDEALQTVKSFLNMAKDKEGIDHLIGLSTIYEKQLENMKKDFAVRYKKPWSEAGPIEQQKWYAQLDRNPVAREKARIDALEEGLLVGRRAELRAEGKSEEQIAKQLADPKEKQAIRQQAEEMNCCQGGSSCKVGKG